MYADWLDERGDPRGELVRIEEEVRFEPAWSDVLWRQKPRRNELRAACDPAWLTAMRYGTDCLPLFYGRPFPDDWRDGWRLIREATERWLGHPMPDIGGHADEVAAVEARLGLTLPPSVRGLVAFLEDLPMVADGPINGGRMGDTSFHLTVLDEYDVLELGGSLCAPLRFGILLADLDVEPLQVLAFGLDYERRSNGVPALHHVRSQELFRFVYEELFTAAFLDYGRRFEGSCDWGACQMWLASEFPYFTPHPAGGIFEGVNRSALLHRGAGGVGLWSQLGLDGLVLPPHLRTADEPEQEPYLQRLASRLAIIATFGLDDIPF